MESKTVIEFLLDGEPAQAQPGETLWQVAKRMGYEIPHLCFLEGYRADGNCRACMVQIEGERTLAASCVRKPSPGMKVSTQTQRVTRAQKMVFELLLADMPANAPPSEFSDWCDRLGVQSSRFSAQPAAAADSSHPAINVDLSACILCTRCLRACREEQVNDVIGFAHRGANSRITFDVNDELGHSSCVACGECVQACPTSALTAATQHGAQWPASASADTSGKTVDTVCPYCGVGCLLTYHVSNDRIVSAEGRDGATNHRRLCVKGRFGFDYIRHQGRLTRPLIRREGVAKTSELISPQNMMDVFREASWDEALEFAARGFIDIRDQMGGDALAGFGSAKGSNEEAYLFQKLIRTGFGTHNVDHCTRLCHASSVAALLEGIGSGAVSNQVADVSQAEVIMVIGSKPTVNHPVAATFMKNAVQAGKKLIVLDPYRSDLARHAEYFVQFRPDTDVPMLNAMMHCIIEEDLIDHDFIAQHTEGFDAIKQNVADFSPQKVAAICGVAADTLRAVARLYACSKGSIIFWGMGISQHIHGTDNARCLIALALMTGQIGRDGCGLHPLRGQNNVQGASDVGLIPMMLPDYRRTSDDSAIQLFEALWQTRLNRKPGLTVVEIMHAIHQGNIHGMYIEGENPAMSDPNLNLARAGLARLDHLVVQDIFFTETAGFADVILPASAFPEKTGTFTNTDRRVQMGRQAVNPPGSAKQDLWIIQQIAQRLGLDWHYQGPQDVFNEMRKAMPSIAGMTWQRLQQEHSLTYPLLEEGDEGIATEFTDGFPTASGRAQFVAAQYSHADELPDEEYPMVFTTGRQLEHWHTGTMTRRAEVLDALEPDPVVSIHPEDLQQYGLSAGEWLQLESRRGQLSAIARADAGMQPGTVFMAFCYFEAAANLLTNAALDPVAKIPEYKYCAVRIIR